MVFSQKESDTPFRLSLGERKHRMIFPSQKSFKINPIMFMCILQFWSDLMSDDNDAVGMVTDEGGMQSLQRLHDSRFNTDRCHPYIGTPDSQALY